MDGVLVEFEKSRRAHSHTRPALRRRMI